MPIDPYENCPCGSGKKFKWCCQKVAKFAERAEQLMNDDQIAAAMQSIDEGLAVEPSNLWLRTIKARMLLSTHDHDAAYPLLDAILADHPGYRPVLMLRMQDFLAHGMAAEAVATLQDMIETTPAAESETVVGWTFVMGQTLADIGHVTAALQHLRAAFADDRAKKQAAQEIAELEGNPHLAPWLKETIELLPGASDGPAAVRWRAALDAARAGCWRRAATIFDSLAAEQPTLAAAHFNLGVCQAWLAQIEAAAASFERYAKLETDPELALVALALAMCLERRESEQKVDVVRVTFPIRGQSLLIQRLKDNRRFQIRVLDAHEQEAEEGVKDEFYLLDKDRVDDAATLTMENMPIIVGSVRTRGPILELQIADPAADDDPRQQLVADAAGDAVDGAGPRELVGSIPLSVHRMQRIWGTPANARPDAVFRFRRLANEEGFLDVLPNTPSGWLNNMTPLEAAQSPDLKLHLRAMVLLDEYTSEAEQFGIDMDVLRGRLGLDPEPTFAGDDVDVERLPLARLRQVKADTLPTPSVVALFNRAFRFMLPLALQNSAATLASRPADRDQFDSRRVFASLIESARMRVDRAAAQQWIDKARRFDGDTGQPPRFVWDVLEWQFSFEFDPPEVSAPRLAQLLTGAKTNPQDMNELMVTLTRVGLAQFVRSQEEPDKVFLDARALEYFIGRFGTRQPGSIEGGQAGKIWTPDSDRGGGSPIVLPGQQPHAPARSKLVLPGS